MNEPCECLKCSCGGKIRAVRWGRRTGKPISRQAPHHHSQPNAHRLTYIVTFKPYDAFLARSSTTYLLNLWKTNLRSRYPSFPTSCCAYRGRLSLLVTLPNVWKPALPSTNQWGLHSESFASLRRLGERCLLFRSQEFRRYIEQDLPVAFDTDMTTSRTSGERVSQRSLPHRSLRRS
jgi:hypothetical protein